MKRFFIIFYHGDDSLGNPMHGNFGIILDKFPNRFDIKNYLFDEYGISKHTCVVKNLMELPEADYREFFKVPEE